MKNDLILLMVLIVVFAAMLVEGCNKEAHIDVRSRYTWCYQTPEGGNWLLYPSTVPPEKQNVPKGYVAVPCPKEEPYAE